MGTSDNLDTVSRAARGNWITVTKTIDNMMITICTHEWKVTKFFTYLHNGEDDDEDVCGRSKVTEVQKCSEWISMHSVQAAGRLVATDDRGHLTHRIPVTTLAAHLPATYHCLLSLSTWSLK